MENQIYIGDNLTVMKSKDFERHLESFKVIYIDPPYNTGEVKSYGDKISNSDWLDFMKPRLELAKKYLAQNGTIFISIDDNEYAQLKLLCDNVFGLENFVGTFITLQAQRSNAKHINTVHEYILCYAKDKKNLEKFVVKRMDIPEDCKIIESLNKKIKQVFNKKGIKAANKELKKLINDYCETFNISWLKNYSNVDENGEIYFAVDLSTPSEPRKVNIPKIKLKLDPLPTRGWSSDNRFIQLHNEKRLCFKDGRPYAKHYLSESEDNAPSLLRFFSRQGTHDLKKLGIGKLFDTPKPVEMLKFLIRMAAKKDAKILDFFAGSGSLAQAVYEVNEEDNKHHSYVLIQIPEKIHPKSEVKNICKKFKIQPSVDEIMLYRIKKFLKSKNKNQDYKIYKI